MEDGSNLVETVGSTVRGGIPVPESLQDGGDNNYSDSESMSASLYSSSIASSLARTFEVGQGGLSMSMASAGGSFIPGESILRDIDPSRLQQPGNDENNINAAPFRRPRQYSISSVGSW